MLEYRGETSLATRERGDADQRGERDEYQRGIDGQTAPFVLANLLEPCRCLHREARRGRVDLTDDRVAGELLRTDRGRKICTRDRALEQHPIELLPFHY